MNFNPTGGVTSRQALSLALMAAICAPRDGSVRTGAFLTVTAETELAESMCGFLGGCITEGQGALISLFPSTTCDEVEQLVLVRRIGDQIHGNTVRPYWPAAQRRMSLLVQVDGVDRAFRVDDQDQLCEVPAPFAKDIPSGVNNAWRRLAQAVTGDAAERGGWIMGSLLTL